MNELEARMSIEEFYDAIIKIDSPLMIKRPIPQSIMAILEESRRINPKTLQEKITIDPFNQVYLQGYTMEEFLQVAVDREHYLYGTGDDLVSYNPLITPKHKDITISRSPFAAIARAYLSKKNGTERKINSLAREVDIYYRYNPFTDTISLEERRAQTFRKMGFVYILEKPIDPAILEPKNPQDPQCKDFYVKENKSVRYMHKIPIFEQDIDLSRVFTSVACVMEERRPVRTTQ